MVIQRVKQLLLNRKRPEPIAHPYSPPPIPPALQVLEPEVETVSLDAYFDQLDAAFSSLPEQPGLRLPPIEPTSTWIDAESAPEVATEREPEIAIETAVEISTTHDVESAPAMEEAAISEEPSAMERLPVLAREEVATAAPVITQAAITEEIIEEVVTRVLARLTESVVRQAAADVAARVAAHPMQAQPLVHATPREVEASIPAELFAPEPVSTPPARPARKRTRTAATPAAPRRTRARTTPRDE